MKCVKGIWLPDHEEHLLQFATEEGWKYQHHKLLPALDLVKNFRRAVDVGGHVGLWSMHLVDYFDHVEAFEPVAEHRECFEKNVSGANLYPYALGEKPGRVNIYIAKGSSGDAYVEGDGDIEVKTLDSYSFDHVDFLKIDTEGFEYFVLRGAEETLKRCKPVVVVEQKPGRAQKFGLDEIGAVKYLQSLGAKLHKEMSGDYLLAW